MCGIAGYIALDGAPGAVAVARRMGDAIRHRGPDGEGQWVSGPVALAHRRLAIVDLSDAGRQPMQTPEGRFTISYNGELYNAAELKAELSALGHRFRSSSDTEVLLTAIAHWGLTPALKRFNGMFAFALWDSHERCLHLARDRFGVKPLYWARFGETVLFGSEIKAILAHPAARTELDADGLSEYLAFQNFHSVRTLFRGIHLLPAASSVSIRPQPDGVGEPDIYYRLAFAADANPKPMAELEAEFAFLFQQSVSRQLTADVEVGAYLSGGLDSGAITGTAASLLPHLRTFTCGFDLSSASGLELYYDERRDAELMSATWHTEHYEMVLKAGDMERVIPRLVTHLEEPRVGQSYPNFCIASLAARFNKVVLAGTGGDELFGGYIWRYTASLGATPQDTMARTYEHWRRLIPADLHQLALAPISGSLTLRDPRDILVAHFPRLAANASRSEMLDAVMTWEANTFLQGLLVVEDKVAMAHGLEARVPFLDNDLVDFATRLPVSARLALDADGQPETGKAIMRRAIAPIVPAAVLERRKQGFSAPDSSWFRGQSIDFVRRRVDHDAARIYRVIDRETIRPLLQDHFSGTVNRRLLIWSLIHLEQAFETWGLA